MSKVKFNDIFGNVTKATKTIEVNDYEIEIKKKLSTVEYISFIHTVVNACFDENGEYHAENKEIAIRYAILKYYTNIDISGNTTDEIFDNYCGDIFDKIENVVNDSYEYYRIAIAIDESIEKRKKTSFDKLCDKLADLVETLTLNADKINTAEFKEIAERLSKLSDNEIVNSIINKPVKKEKTNGKKH